MVCHESLSTNKENKGNTEEWDEAESTSTDQLEGVNENTNQAEDVEDSECDESTSYWDTAAACDDLWSLSQG